MLIPNNSPLPTTGDVYLKSGGRDCHARHAHDGQVPAGNVYLSVNGVNANQKLILASGGKLTTTVDAAAQFLAPPSLIVYKIIQGPAHGLQGQIQIDVTCGTTKLESFIINAEGDGGHALEGLQRAGWHSEEFGRQASLQLKSQSAELPVTVAPRNAAGSFTECSRVFGRVSSCTVTETLDGSNTTVTATVAISGSPVDITQTTAAAVTVTDTYDSSPGRIRITKTVSGGGDATGLSAVFRIEGRFANGQPRTLSLGAQRDQRQRVPRVAAV